MPRALRTVKEGVPLHIMQRGVDRCATFLAADDFAFYRLTLLEASLNARCAVHAYVLMSNHVHLLVTPTRCDGPARLMSAVGRRYVRFFNARYGRTGTLWEGRFRSKLVEKADYVLDCSRYIEENPVRAGLATAPQAYEWSSHRANAFGAPDELITPREEYLALGRNINARLAAYRELFAAPLETGRIARIRAETHGVPGLPLSLYAQQVAAMRGAESDANGRAAPLA